MGDLRYNKSMSHSNNIGFKIIKNRWFEKTRRG